MGRSRDHRGDPSGPASSRYKAEQLPGLERRPNAGLADALEPAGSSVPTPPRDSDGAAGVEVRRSARRRRTVSAYREGDRTVVLIPARMSRAEERRWVTTMLQRLAAKERRQQSSDEELARRAAELSRRHLGGRAEPASVRWVTNQNTRWGSCTPGDASIRLSHRLQGMPGYVVDYVLVHELAHLLVSGHGPRFWSLVDAFPRTERARGYLEGVAATAGLALDDADDAPEPGRPDPGDALSDGDDFP